VTAKELHNATRGLDDIQFACLIDGVHHLRRDEARNAKAEGTVSIDTDQHLSQVETPGSEG
jgi:hypothetical protein